jgi:uncharacterized PurR-regulated membrane protein YhhQ (DUF165 family)
LSNDGAKAATGWVCLALFMACIPFANWWLDRHGFWHFGFLGAVPSAVWVVGFAFVLRDLAQITLGKWWTWAAIVVGALLSWWLASPTLAVASGAAFLWSESTDALIFTPLANRGQFLLGVTISGYAASAVDSALFVRLAFHSYNGWWQLTVAKIAFVMLATPVAYGIRRALSVNTVQPASA